MEELEKYYQTFEGFKKSAAEGDDQEVPQQLADMQEEAYHLLQFATTEDEEMAINELIGELKEFKKEQGYYDAEEELDRMFPNRHDDDSDEDSTSYRSVFGDD